MSYQNLLDSLDLEVKEKLPSIDSIPKYESPIDREEVKPSLFNIDVFINNIERSSIEENIRNSNNQININAYDISSGCIRSIIYKLTNFPIEDKYYKDTYLPIKLKAQLGHTIHNFILNNYAFTEKEGSMRIPSIHTSIRFDALINDNVLVEIKSLPYFDYDKIIKTRKPRDEDFLQAIFYRYLLHNHLEESKNQTNLRTSPPILDKYNIRHIQIIYIANDLLSSDLESISEVESIVHSLKKLLVSKLNQFWFITALTFDSNIIDFSPFETYVCNKLTAIINHLKANTIPGRDDPFCNSKFCFFCAYKNICN